MWVSNSAFLSRSDKPTSKWVKWLGTSDQIVEYFKPKTCPKWMTPEAYKLLNESIQVRELRYRITRRGYRVREVLLVTTLLDAGSYPASELASLYQKRWEIETNLRHLKQTLGMDVLRTKTVDRTSLAGSKSVSGGPFFVFRPDRRFFQPSGKARLTTVALGLGQATMHRT